MLTFKQFITEAKWSGRIEHSIGDDNHQFLKAYDGDKEIGSIEYKHQPKLNRLDVWMLKVHPDHQKKGIGTTLMDAAKARHPEAKWDYGTLTFDGRKFLRKYDPEGGH